MTRHDRVRLREAIRVCIGELKAQGRFTTRELTRLMTERYGDLVVEASDRLIAESLASIARSLMRNDTPSARARQLFLPMEIAHLRLPDSISLPPRNDESDETEGGEFLWSDISEATFNELEEHIQYLTGQIAADVQRLRTLRELHGYLAPIMADDRREDAIGPVLEEIAGREREAI